MKKLLILCVTVVSFASAQANANEMCKKIQSASVILLTGKAKGASKEKMLSSLPPLEANAAEPLRSFYQMADEIFDYPTLDGLVYSIYRAELCHLIGAEKASALDTFQDSHPELKRCSELDGKRNKAMCSMKVASSIASGENT